jgi:hypothetical protein
VVGFMVEDALRPATRTIANAMHIFYIAESTRRVCYHPSNDLPKLSSKAFCIAIKQIIRVMLLLGLGWC